MAEPHFCRSLTLFPVSPSICVLSKVTNTVFRVSKVSLIRHRSCLLSDWCCFLSDCHYLPAWTGHYVSLVKSHNSWLFFDDESVEPISEHTVQTTFGATQDYSNNMDHGYILMYERQSKSCWRCAGACVISPRPVDVFVEKGRVRLSDRVSVAALVYLRFCCWCCAGLISPRPVDGTVEIGRVRWGALVSLPICAGL